MTKKYYEDMTNITKFCSLVIPDVRVGQIGAINCIIDRRKSGHSTTSIVLPCRYGKSDVLRVSCLELVLQGLHSYGIIVTPSSNLTTQLNDISKIKEMQHRFKLTVSPKFDRIDSWKTPLRQNDAHWYAMTTQMLSLNIDKMCDEILIARKRGIMPPVVFIDECQNTSDSNEWGKMIPKLLAAGVYVVFVTATPFRASSDLIHGFTWRDITPEAEIERSKVKYVGDNMIEVEKWKSIRSQKELVADYEIPFVQGWDEGVICKLNVTWIEVDATVNAEEKKLGECRIPFKNLSAIARNSTVVEHVVDAVISEILHRRQSKPRTTGIIFCSNDDKNSNDHCKQIRDYALMRDPSLNVVIVTSATDDAAKKLERFRDGTGDILVVKQMASIGLDIDHLKVAADLSPYRTDASFIQRVMRVATIWGDVTNADVILPNDSYSRSLFERFITNEHGMSIIEDVNLLNTELKSIVEGDEGKSVLITNAYQKSVSDTDGRNEELTIDTGELMRRFDALYPEMVNFCSAPQRINMAKRAPLPPVSSSPPPNSSGPVDFEALRKSLRSGIDRSCKDNVKHELPNYNQDTYGKLYSKVHAQACQQAGCTDYKNESRIDVLKKILTFLKTRLASPLTAHSAV